MSAEKIVEHSWTPAFSCGADGVITAWNRGAEKLLATSGKTVVGRKCHEVMDGRDMFGNDYCCAGCASWRMTAANKLVHPYRLTVRDRSGRSLTLKVSVLAVHDSQGPQLVHLIEAVFGTGVFAVVGDDLDDESEEWGCASPALTRRELQVLRHLAIGNNTDEIGRQLMISRATVRSHISRCLQKLEVHSRLEAIGVARSLGLV
jgi:DNA-binding CsgD family transcriptional regulator